jgi:peptidoglycan/xylan/chitin deacetylase (PgdA/CDA1 family)
MHRRSFLSGIAALPFAAGATASVRGPGIAVTVDDFNLSDDVLMTGMARDAAIRAALTDHGIQGAGFVSGKYIETEVGASVLSAWSAQGHILGNHTFSHTYYSGSDSQGYMIDILKCEGLLAPYSGFRKLFRYPFLGEGKTAEGRDRLRALLRAAGYRIGHVTIDTTGSTPAAWLRG